MEIGYYGNERCEVLELIPNRPNSVLELGCGKGVFGRLLKEKYNCKVTGIELFEDAAKVAEMNIDKVYNESLDAFDFDKLDKYDLIIANDVLEHLMYPWKTVRALREHLDYGGYFMASIPNVQNHKVMTALLKGRWDYADAGIMDRTHLRFFTKTTAAELFSKNGYNVEKVIPINVDKASKRNIFKRTLKLFFSDWYALQFEIISTVRKL